MIEAAISYILLNTSAITALVSSRSYPIAIPQGTALPAVSFSRISTERGLHHGGPTNVSKALFQLSAWALTALEAKSIAHELKKAFHGYTGTAASQKIFIALAVDERDLFDFDTGDGVYHCSVDVLFTFPES
jgi:hypothetical protein